MSDNEPQRGGNIPISGPPAPISGPPAGPYQQYGIPPYLPGPFDLYPAPNPLDFSGRPRKHVREYYRLFMKRKWVILLCVAVALIFAAIYSLRQTPIYEATAKLQIDMESDNVLPQSFNQGPSYFYNYREFLQTQIKHINSRALAARVVAAAGLDREAPAAVQPPEHLSLLYRLLSGTKAPQQPGRILTQEERARQAIGLVLGGLRVTPVRDSRVVEISFSSPDPLLAARIVNTAMSEYVEYNFQAKYDSNTRATDFLKKQLVDLKAKVEESDASLIEYGRNHSIMTVMSTGEKGENQDVVLQTLAELNTKLINAVTERMEKESTYRTLATATPDNFPQALRTDLINRLENGLVGDEQDLARLTSQFGPSMPQVKQLEAKVQQTKEQLLREKRLALENSDNEYKKALANEKLLSAAYEKQKALADQLNDSNIHYAILKREVETNKQLYDGLLQRMKEAVVAAGLKSSNIRVVDQAEVPTGPANNDFRRNLYLALGAGLMAGFSLALFLNYLDSNIKTPEDVEEKAGLPALGLIPSLQSSSGHYGYYHRNPKKKIQTLALEQQGVELASLTASSSSIAEAYRSLRTALLLSMPNNPPRTIMITSCRAGEGKTTTVCNTAISLTQAGKKVLIIDCDMRRPKIRRVFNGNGNAGLSEYLTGQIGIDALVQGTNVSNLFVAYAGAYPPNPGELLGSTRMQDLLRAVAGDFEFVLLDTPPMMSVMDAIIMAPITDGVILVAKGGVNSPEILKRAKKSLEMVRARIIGVVCNNVNIMHSDYHHYLKQYTEYVSYMGGENLASSNYQRSEVRDQTSEVRDQRSEVRGRR